MIEDRVFEDVLQLKTTGAAHLPWKHGGRDNLWKFLDKIDERPVQPMAALAPHAGGETGP